MEKARIVAQNFMGKSRSASKNISDVVTEQFERQNSFYVINFHEGGWVMVAADDIAIPVLAYSAGGVYRTEDEKPPAFRYLIDEYKEQIDIARRTELKRTDEIKEKWENLQTYESNTMSKCRVPQKSAILNTGTYTPGDSLLYDPARGYVSWGQIRNNSGTCAPSYNAKAPKTAFLGLFDNCDCYDRPPVGCGAVAMGQVMWYWQWPKTSTYRAYNWNLMPYKLTNQSTQAEGDEIANLLRDCGVAADMWYACAGSFTFPDDIQEALTDDFGFKSARLVDRDDWGLAWNNLIKTEIDCRRPVIYKGEKSLLSTEKHYFVIDGYSATDTYYFHINFGWRGADNGFFYLNNITPDGDNFNKRHTAIIGISPTYAENVNITDVPYTTVTGNMVVEAQQNISLPAPGKSLIVENGASLTLVAGNSITLNPGFEIRPGGTFTTNIEPAYSTGAMDITVSFWPSEIQGIGVILMANNANSFDFIAKDGSGNTVHRNAGLIQSNIFIPWYVGFLSSGGIYTCTIRLRNNYGRILEHTWNVEFIPSSSKSSTNSDTTNNYLQEFSAPPSGDFSETIALTADDIVIYPNPSSGMVNISIVKQFSAYSLKVYSLGGTLVYADRNITQPSYSFDMSGFADGTYTVQIATGNNLLSKKIILSR
ncbi:MAG: thiol protease/hemagglutinin PrtT [Bacteroidales bacterium]|nr:thiol protease/hemagglutinin PrtT [Bacteroidales bacterium]